MVSEALRSYAEQVWAETAWLEQVDPPVYAAVEEAQGTEQVFLKLLYGSLPASDTAGVPIEIIRSYARHGVYLLEQEPRVRDIPEDIFVHYVLYPRINSETLVHCRPFFYEKLAPVIRGLEGEAAVLAVNRWCAGQMTYASTDDRTIDPLTAYFSGSGRCGEESTFAVTALRSVGIPARQVYATWWSHCDDNHAWVETYVQGRWRFLGACEPEPVLDRGWFNRAASRAMLICSRRFCSFGVPDEVLCRTEGSCMLYNQTSRYCRTTCLEVLVLDGACQPVRGGEVRFFVLNAGKMSLIAALETDYQGRVILETGLGSLYMEASYGEGFTWTVLNTNKETACTLHLTDVAPKEGDFHWDLMAPAALCGPRRLTEQEAREKMVTLQRARQQREIKQKDRPVCETGDPALDAAFKEAGRNGQVLRTFYEAHPEGRSLLLNLSPKDWKDVTLPVLEAFLPEKLPFQPLVHSPRIGFEALSDWKTAVLEFLTAAQKRVFSQEPEAAWDWIQQTFREGGYRWAQGLWLQPEVALKLRAADERGRKLLFVAIMRALGIPAKLNHQSPQYWNGERFCTAGEREDLSLLILEGPHPSGDSWSLDRWVCGRWCPLGIPEEQSMRLPMGTYRIITTNRLPNGDQLAWCRIFRLGRKEEKLAVQVRSGNPEQMLARYPIGLQDRPGPIELRIWLEPGTEPTEHILNELASCAESFQHGRLRLVLLVPEGEQFRDFRADSAGAEILPDAFDGEELECLARALYQEPGLLPLICLTDGITAFYGHSGYAVGTIPLILSLVKLLDHS